jgi:hypothetical protein
LLACAAVCQLHTALLQQELLQVGAAQIMQRRLPEIGQLQASYLMLCFCQPAQEGGLQV